MNKKLLVGGAIAIAALFISTGTVLASSSTYKFLVRGIVTEVDKDNKTITVAGNHASALAKDDLAGNLVEFNTSGAKIYKWVSGKKVRITLGGVPVGNEVVMEGVKRSDTRFNVTKITVNDNAFNVVGILRGHDEDDKKLTVDVSYTDYKSATFKDKRITFHYGNNTKFTTKTGAEMNVDELDDGDQQIKITGTVTNGSKWEALKVIDQYPKAK